MPHNMLYNDKKPNGMVLMKSTKKTVLIAMTVALAIALLFAVTACSFTFGDSGTTAAPKTTGYVVMTTAEEPNAASSSLEDVIESLAPKVVEVYSAVSGGTGAGSGVIVSKVSDKDGVQTGSIVVTNHHVIADASQIVVKLHNGERYEAKLIGSDAPNDIAVLEIAATGIEPAVWLEDSDKVRVGSTAIVIGNALGTLGGTVTKGIISGTAREMEMEDGGKMTLLQTDASINGGNSGGGLFSASGLLVGIVNSKMTSTQTTIEGLGFAIPSNTARHIAETLMNNIDEESGFGYIPGRYDIGVTLANIRNGFNVYVGVSEIDTDGCAYKAGIRLKDQIVSVTYNGVTETDGTAMAEMLSSESYRIGDVLTVVRKSAATGLQETVTVTVSQYVYTM